MTTATSTVSAASPVTTNKEISDLAFKLDRYIFAQRRSNGEPVTVGLVVAALGLLLAAKPTTPEHNERMVSDMTTAIRAAFHERYK